MTDQTENPQEIVFHYIKSNHFRVVHADGVWGGVTPRGLVQINFYSERQPIPKQTVHGINEDQTLGDEIQDQRVTREGVVREIEFGAVMDLRAAKSLRDWLDKKLQVVEDLLRSEGSQ